MSDVRKRYPDRALARAAGMESDYSSASNNRFQTYTSCRDLQTRHVARRCGLSRYQSHLVATLFFGEDLG